MARILVYTPTYENRLQPQTVESIKALDFNGQLDWVLSDENPYPGRDMRNCQFQFKKGRQLAIDGEYDGLLLIEHDMIVPQHAAQRLWDTPAPVVYGTYMLRHLMFCVNLFQFTGGRNVGMSLSIYPRELQFARRQGWIEVSGAGFGCLLIRRDVFLHVPFRDTGNAPDLPFAKDCVDKKIQQIGRTDVECGHIDTDHSGQILWPFEDGVFGMIARVLARQDVVVQDNGQSVPMKKGRYYSLGVEIARELQRAGFVEITNDADIVTDEIADGQREVATDPRAEKRKYRSRKRA